MCRSALLAIDGDHRQSRSFEGSRSPSDDGGRENRTSQVVKNVALHKNGFFELDVHSAGDDVKLTVRNLIAAAGHRNGGARDSPSSHHLVCAAAGVICQRPLLHHVWPHILSASHLPVPVEGGLGTHLTLDMSGRARFGPDVQWVDRIDYAFDDARCSRRAEFERSIRRYWPGVPDGALEPGYTGIRPKISGKGATSRFTVSKRMASLAWSRFMASKAQASHLASRLPSMSRL